MVERFAKAFLQRFAGPKGLVEVSFGQDKHLHWFARRNRGVARLAREKGNLPKEIARTECGVFRRETIFCARNVYGPRFNNVEFIAHFALPNNDLTLTKQFVFHQSGEFGEYRDGLLREDGTLLQKCDDLDGALNCNVRN